MRKAFPDIESALLDWLKDVFEEVADGPGEIDEHVGVERPGESLEARMPFVSVRRTGGTSDQLEDYPQVEIEVFGPSRSRAYDLAQSIHVELLTTPVYAGGVVIDAVDSRVSPRRLPWENVRVWRFGATYTLSVRRR